MEETKVGYIYVPHYTPYIPSTSRDSRNTIVQTKEFTKEEIYIAGTFSIILWITLILFVIYMIKEFIKYSK